MSRVEINEDYFFLKDNSNIIGKGGFGTVYKCSSKKHPQLQLCIKVYDLHTNNLHLIKQLSQESQVIQCLEQASHMNLITIYYRGYFNNCNNYCIIMDMCTCDLSTYINERRIQQNPFKEAEILSFIKQISNGYKSLLARKIIHRDIKPANILVNVYQNNFDPNNKKLYYKIADLDCSKIFTEITNSCNKGTWLYCSPESDEPKPQTEQSDIFSFGCTLYYLLYGKHFKIRKENQGGLRRYSDYIENKFDKLIGFSPNMESDIIQFLKQCLQKDVQIRIKWLDVFQWKLIKDFQINYSQPFDSLLLDQTQILNQIKVQKLEDRTQRLKNYFNLLRYKINVTFMTINLLKSFYDIAITKIFIIGLLNLMKQYYNFQLGLISENLNIIPKFLAKDKKFNFPKDDLVLYVTELMQKKNMMQGETALKERIIELEERINQISQNSKYNVDSASQSILNEQNRDSSKKLDDLLRESIQEENILQSLKFMYDQYLLSVFIDENIIQRNNNLEVQKEIIKNIKIIIDFETTYDQTKYNEVVITQDEIERIKGCQL